MSTEDKDPDIPNIENLDDSVNLGIPHNVSSNMINMFSNTISDMNEKKEEEEEKEINKDGEKITNIFFPIMKSMLNKISEKKDATKGEPLNNNNKPDKLSSFLNDLVDIMGERFFGKEKDDFKSYTKPILNMLVTAINEYNRITTDSTKSRQCFRNEMEQTVQDKLVEIFTEGMLTKKYMDENIQAICFIERVLYMYKYMYEIMYKDTICENKRRLLNTVNTEIETQFINVMKQINKK